MKLRIQQWLRDTRETPAALRFGVGALAAIVALTVRFVLDPVLGAQSPYLVLVLAVMASARYGGRGPGLASTALCALGALYIFIDPRGSLVVTNYQALISLILFGVVGAVVSVVVGHYRESVRGVIATDDALRRKTLLVDLSHDAIISADSERRITRWNAGATEMYGWTPNEALGKVMDDLLGTSGPIPMVEIDAILRREERWDGELNHTSKQGHRIVVESRQVLARGDNGEPIGILEVNRDITDRKRAEEESRQANEQRRLALESADMGTWAIEAGSCRILWDARCAKLFGFPVGGQVESSDLISRIYREDRATVDAMVKLAELCTAGETYDREVRVIWPDESLHWLALHGRCTFECAENDGGAAHLVGVCMEITERRRAEEKLRQTQKLETIGLLAGGVAHDFNNLLTVIMGSASAAIEEHPESQHYAAIVAASQQAACLTKQLLAYAGKGKAEVKTIDLSEFVSQARGFLSASIPKRVVLGFNLATDRPCLEAAPSQVEQILMNLVINAGEQYRSRAMGWFKSPPVAAKSRRSWPTFTPLPTMSLRALLFVWKCGTTAPGWTRRRARTSSIRSLRPSSRAAVLAWQRLTG